MVADMQADKNDHQECQITKEVSQLMV